jgi:tartrate-resistant acid phosphatase type 5
VLSGGGGADLYDLKIQSAARGPMAQKVYGFSDLEIANDKLILTHFDESGRVLHRFAKKVDGTVEMLG